jgi:predicted  nucleic acid-binding Zn-ribbon protein
MNHLEKHKSALKTYAKATEETEEVNQMSERQEDPRKMVEEKEAEIAKLTEQVKGLETELEETKKQLAEATHKLLEAEVDKAWKEALEAGKVLPAEEKVLKELAMKDLDLFKKMVESRPKLVEFDEKGGADTSDLKEKAEKMVEEYRKQGMSLKDAYIKLEQEHPELFGALR